MKAKKIPKAIKMKPRKGYVFLKDLEEGVSFVTEGQLEGTVINNNDGSVLCLFKKNDYEEPADRNYWLGQKRIAPLTNVKKKGS
tara:strand:- start:253 stop:504 length:252 start_codon:yes stop_codon:yes gene_type:complete